VRLVRQCAQKGTFMRLGVGVAGPPELIVSVQATSPSGSSEKWLFRAISDKPGATG
jgi:hypothetical protein